MIDFKKRVSEILPYDRKKYIEYLAEKVDPSVKWYGASFQVPEIVDRPDDSFQQYLEVYEPLFKSIIAELDNGLSWIVNHDDKDLPWFPNENDTLPELRTLFKQNNISNAFKGALIFSIGDLLKYSKDLVSYPFTASGKKGFLYKNLDISHSEMPAVIKISGHLTIDFLSTEQPIFMKIRYANFVSGFDVKEYRGN